MAHAVKSIQITHMDCVLIRPCPGWIGSWAQARSRRTFQAIVKSFNFSLNMMKGLYRILSQESDVIQFVSENLLLTAAWRIDWREARTEMRKLVARLFQLSSVLVGLVRSAHMSEIRRTGLGYRVMRGCELKIISRILEVHQKLGWTFDVPCECQKMPGDDVQLDSQCWRHRLGEVAIQVGFKVFVLAEVTQRVQLEKMRTQG